MEVSNKGRLLSLDAFRGFDMLWIIGFDQIVRQAAGIWHWPWLGWLAGQMEHPYWEGFKLYDLIFPTFLFIVGVAIPFSIGSQRRRGVKDTRICVKAALRMVVLIILGLVYNCGLNFAGVAETRFCSVLGLIGIGYFFATLIVLRCGIRGQVLWLLGIFLGCLAAVCWYPVPGVGAGVITPDGSFAGCLDRLLVPGRLYFGSFDPEGAMSCISGITTALLGTLAGQWLMREGVGKWQKALGLLCGGCICAVAGAVLGCYYPIIKNLWSGSFVLLAAGLSGLGLCLFYVVIDCLEFRKWSVVFTVIGMNSITIYMACCMVNFGHTSGFIFGGVIRMMPDVYHPILYSVAVLLVEWLFLFILYKKRIFLKV